MKTILRCGAFWAAILVTFPLAAAEPDAQHALTLDAAQPRVRSQRRRAVSRRPQDARVGRAEDGGHRLRHVGQALVFGGLGPRGRNGPADERTAGRRAEEGALVIHAPSDTMPFYKDTPQRKLAQAAPKAEPKVPLKGWCGLDPARTAAAHRRQRRRLRLARRQVAQGLDPADRDAEDRAGRRRDRQRRGLQPHPAAGHRERGPRRRAYEHVRAGPAVRHPADGLPGEERGARPRHDRRHVQPAAAAAGRSLPRHGTGGRTRREVLVPDGHQQRLPRRAGLPLSGRQAAARGVPDQRGRIRRGRDAARFRPPAPRPLRLLLHRGAGPRQRPDGHRGPEDGRRGRALRPPQNAAQGADGRVARVSRRRQAVGRAADGQPRVLDQRRDARRTRAMAHVRPRRAGVRVSGAHGQPSSART